MKLTKPQLFLLAVLLAALAAAGTAGGQVWVPAPPPAPSPPPPAGPGAAILAEAEVLIYRFTNEIRARYNLPPLAREEALEGLARTHCQDMLQRRFFSHYTPEGLAPKDRVTPHYPYQIYRLGENIWKGFNQSLNNPEDLARFIVDGWMNSPGHRENIFCPDFTHLGIGVAVLGRDLRAAQLFVNLQGHHPF